MPARAPPRPGHRPGLFYGRHDMAKTFVKSPRQRLDWFGSRTEFDITTTTTDNGIAGNQQLLVEQPRLSLSAGTVDAVAFPAGIVRGDSCSVARFIGYLTIFDVDRRNQNISYDVGAGIIKQEAQDTFIADPFAAGAIGSAPDALQDLRASWMWHSQMTWNPQAGGANYQHLDVSMKVDSTNSRIFESNEVMQLSVQVRTLQNGGVAAVSTTVRCRLLWRCLLRLD